MKKLAETYPQHHFFDIFPRASSYADFTTQYRAPDVWKILHRYIGYLRLPPGTVVEPAALEARLRVSGRTSALDFERFCEAYVGQYGAALEFLSRLRYGLLLDMVEVCDVLPRLGRALLGSVPPVARIIAALFSLIRSCIADAVDAASLPFLHRYILAASPRDLLERLLPRFRPFFAAPQPRTVATYIELVRELENITLFDGAFGAGSSPPPEGLRGGAGDQIAAVAADMDRLLLRRKDVDVSTLDHERLVLLLDSWVSADAAWGRDAIWGGVAGVRLRDKTATLVASVVRSPEPASTRDVVTMLSQWACALGGEPLRTAGGTDAGSGARAFRLPAQDRNPLFPAREAREARRPGTAVSGFGGMARAWRSISSGGDSKSAQDAQAGAPQVGAQPVREPGGAAGVVVPKCEPVAERRQQRPVRCGGVGR